MKASKVFLKTADVMVRAAVIFSWLLRGFIPDMHYGIMRRYMLPWMTYSLNC